MKFGGFVILVMCACGDVKDPNKLPDAPLGSDGSPGDADVDAAIDAAPPRCDASKPFGTPTLVPELNSTAQDMSPWLTPDELSVYLSSTRPGGLGGFDIYLATRADLTSAWGTPSIVAGVNTANLEGHPTVTADGLTMYAETEPVGAANRQIVVATRTSPTGSFSALSPVNVLNDADVDASPYVLPDHSALYMTSRRNGSNNIQAFRATRQSNAFTAPMLVVGTMFDIFDDHSYVAITPDELQIYFASPRAGGAGGTDIWLATRSSLAVGFSAPTPVTELNTAAPEAPGWISPDTCVLYMARITGTTAGFSHIYVATKPL